MDFRDKSSPNMFWLKDESLKAPDNLLDPDVIAQEIVEDLEAALKQFLDTPENRGDEDHGRL